MPARVDPPAHTDARIGADDDRTSERDAEPAVEDFEREQESRPSFHARQP